MRAHRSPTRPRTWGATTRARGGRGVVIGTAVVGSRRHRARRGLVGVDQVGVPGLVPRRSSCVPRPIDPAVLEVHHLVGERDRRLAVGDHHERPVDPSRRPRPANAAPPGSAPRPGGPPRRWRRRGPAVEDGERARGPARRWRWPPDERRPPLAHLGVEAVGQGGYEPVGLGRAQRGPHVFVGDVGAERDVAAHGVVEHERLLEHQCAAPAARPCGGPEVVPVDLDLARVGVDQTGQQAGQRALARCGCADQRHGAAGADREVDAVQQRARRRR